jgi:cell pole-organizing protein PopZ
MEEILASIRRIIADDDTKIPPTSMDPMPPPPRPIAAVVPPLPPAPVEPEIKPEEVSAALDDTPPPEPELPQPEVLELTESMTMPTPPPADGFRTIDGEPDVVFEDSPEETAPMPMMAPPRRAPPPEPSSLISSNTSAAVDSAFNTLAHTVLVQNARTLDDLVREMLRPLLKGWLDDNLPSLVERLVRAEIERVSRGRS